MRKWPVDERGAHRRRDHLQHRRHVGALERRRTALIRIRTIEPRRRIHELVHPDPGLARLLIHGKRKLGNDLGSRTPPGRAVLCEEFLRSEDACPVRGRRRCPAPSIRALCDEPGDTPRCTDQTPAYSKGAFAAVAVARLRLKPSLGSFTWEATPATASGRTSRSRSTALP